MNTKLNSMNEALALNEKQLDNMNAVLSLANLIRGLIKEGRSINYIDTYLETTVKVGINTKESLLESISKSHKEIAEYHKKMSGEES